MMCGFVCLSLEKMAILQIIGVWGFFPSLLKYLFLSKVSHWLLVAFLEKIVKNSTLLLQGL